jgi:gliding motility-associated-like protein
MKGGVSEYRIYYSVNGSNYLQVATTTGTSFVHTNVNPSANVSYYVRAFNATKSVTSSSNRVFFFTFQTPAPSFIYLRTVSVMDDENVALRFFVDSTKTGNGFDIYRSEDGLSFAKIGFVAANGVGNYSYSDSDLKTKEKSYYYYAVVKDSCGNDRTTSNTAQSILLRVTNNKSNFFQKHLTWNNYLGFSGGIAGYNIYRVVNDEFPLFPTGYTNGAINEYTDNLEEAAPEGSKIEYIVSAVEGATNIYGILENANSNKATAYIEADVFIPTAFAPKGVNKVWKPVTHFVDKSDYTLRIYNRWGNLLFSTNDFNEGWTGNGAPNDVYVYLIDFKNSRGEYIQLKGTFTLL